MRVLPFIHSPPPIDVCGTGFFFANRKRHSILGYLKQPEERIKSERILYTFVIHVWIFMRKSLLKQTESKTT